MHQPDIVARAAAADAHTQGSAGSMHDRTVTTARGGR